MQLAGCTIASYLYAETQCTRDLLLMSVEQHCLLCMPFKLVELSEDEAGAARCIEESSGRESVKQCTLYWMHAAC